MILRRLVLAMMAMGTVMMSAPRSGAQGLRPERLRCEYRVDPAGIDRPAPRLTWIVTSAERNAEQAAYRLLVASTPERLAADVGDLWDTGKVDSTDSLNVAYAGEPLPTHAECFWKV